MELYELSALLWAIGVFSAAALSLGGALSTRLDILAHFAPLYLLGGLIAIALQIVRGAARGRWAVGMGAGAMLVATALMAPDVVAGLTAPMSPPARQTLKIVQLNLWSKNVDPKATAAWIARQNADAVVLEEVIDGPSIVPFYLLRAYPYRAPGPVRFDTTTMILSKTRPVDAGAYPSPDTFGRHSGAWATFGHGADAYTVVGTHAPWPAPPGLQQSLSGLLATRLRAFDRDSLILAGDFNATPWSFSLRRQDAQLGLNRRTHAMFSWSARPYSRYKVWTPVPLMPIDHVYAGNAWKTVSVETGPKLGSDHLPIVVVLTR